MKRVTFVVLGVAAAAGVCSREPVVRAAGELQGQVLRPAPDLESGLGTLIGGLLGVKSQPPQGSITGAVVTEDGPQRLTLAVQCEGALQGRRFRGELLDSDHRYQRQFRPASATADSDRCEAALSFEPRSGGGGTLPMSAYVRVSVEGGGASNRLFALGKTWGGESSGGSAQGLAFVKVKALPEPKAAALPLAEPTPAPVRPPVTDVRDHRGEPGGVIVRDQGGRTGRPEVRDHRGGAGQPEVRDHRGETRQPEVRDHRGDARQPEVTDHRGGGTPEVRDHRGGGAPAWTSPQQREVVLAQAGGAVNALPQSHQVYTLDAGAFALTAADRGKGATGPNPADQHQLLDGIEKEDGVTLDPAQVTSLHGTVYRDQNPNTGYFYYLPEAYHLGWLADQGRYDMSVLYLAATTPGAAGQVSMAAGLTSGIDLDELAVAKKLVQAYCQTHSCTVTELKPFPVDPARAVPTLAGSLSLFNIPPDKVAPIGLSNAMGAFRMAWVTDPVTKENVQLVLEQSGLDGTVTFPALGTEQAAQPIGVRIKLGDPGSFSRPRWRRGEPWRNPTPYPVRVKYLHALMTNPAGTLAVYSWNLGGSVVAPGGRMECDASAVPPWVDTRALRLWVDYGVATGCDSCTQKLVKDITGGVTSVAASQITFHTIKPLAEMGAHELAVKVRSRRFDPDGRQMRQKSVVLDADDHDFTLGPIYVDEASGDDALFEYFVTVAMADGTEYEAKTWVGARDLRVLVGRSQIEKSLGFGPGASPAAPPSPAAPDRDRDQEEQ